MKRVFFLYDFDHGLSSPQQFAIGPFMIEVTKEHVEACQQLYRRGKTIVDALGNVSKIPEKRGIHAITAEAHFTCGKNDEKDETDIPINDLEGGGRCRPLILV